MALTPAAAKTEEGLKQPLLGNEKVPNTVKNRNTIGLAKIKILHETKEKKRKKKYLKSWWEDTFREWTGHSLKVSSH